MDNLFKKIEPLLRNLKHPSRYIGGEYGSVQIDSKNEGFNFCMIYPDLYDVGQSNQAVRILCNRANEVDGIYAQRSFLPDPLTIKVFKDNNIPMFSLESFSPIEQFDAIGITIGHDLLATNILETLDFANIPIKSKDRTENCPFVFGGGPICCNPEPYHEFFDVFTIGEGEIATIKALMLIKDLKSKNYSRIQILHELSKLDHIYVPSMYELNEKSRQLVPKYCDVPKTIKRAIYTGFSDSCAYEPCIVPFVEIIHDRLNIEILRGCTRGCRFCQAGIMYRPVRERNKQNICESIIKGLKDTGYDEVSLTSLSTTDHSQIGDILKDINTKLINKGIRISIPSQRLDSFGIDMAKLVAGNKKGGLTFAIEAGTQRLRNVINKNVTDKDIFFAVEQAFKNGWNRAKLYFMIGLPTESDDDLIGISQLCEKVLATAKTAAGDKRKHGVGIYVSCAIFVPKAQTPFMFDGQINYEEAIRRINIIRKNIKSKAINFSWHSAETSQIEAVLSRGDRKCSQLIYKAWKNGSKFDAWNEYFNYNSWKLAAERLNINLDELAAKKYKYKTNFKDNCDSFPWSHIDFGVNKEFFINERLAADNEQTTKDCSFGKCIGCGICKNLNVNLDIAGKRKC